MSDSPAPPRIFSGHRRACARDRLARAIQRGSDADYVARAMADEVLERLDWVTRDFADALVIGDAWGLVGPQLRAKGMAVTLADPGPLLARMAGGTPVTEDQPHWADGSFDLVIALGTLDSVNDLPGALALMRRALRPDGLMLASLIGAGSLARLKAAMLAADGDRPAPRIHPQIDVRAAGDLLQRTGYAMPVADSEMLTVRFGHLMTLVHDLRAMGMGNMLADPGPALTRSALIRAMAHFAEAADADGKTAESFALIHLSGWAPAPSQPRPARRGSATASLAAALKGPNKD